MTCDSVLPLADPPPVKCLQVIKTGPEGRAVLISSLEQVLLYSCEAERWSYKFFLGDNRVEPIKILQASPSCCVATLSFQEPWVIKEARLETTEADIVDRCRHTNVAYL